jgi:hypothetical protein
LSNPAATSTIAADEIAFLDSELEKSGIGSKGTYDSEILNKDEFDALPNAETPSYQSFIKKRSDAEDIEERISRKSWLFG